MKIFIKILGVLSLLFGVLLSFGSLIAASEEFSGSLTIAFVGGLFMASGIFALKQ
jgi:hypothetical protein